MDLVPVSLNAPPSAMPGYDFQVSDRVCNDGDTPTPSSEARYYLSADASIDVSDTQVGQRSIPPLQPGQCNNGAAIAFTSVPDGAYWLGIIVDPQNSIAEGNEVNNAAAGPQFGVGFAPDFVITSVTGPASAQQGQLIEVRATVCNQGTQPTYGAQVSFYFSDSFLGSIPIYQQLDPGRCRVAYGMVPAYPGSPYTDGPYYLSAIADEQNNTAELIETNNERIGTQVGIGIGSDLVISSLTGPYSSLPGQQITVQTRVCNRGTTGIGSVEVSVYSSNDTVIDGSPDDSFLGTLTVSGWLESGSCISTQGWVVANPAPPFTDGAYYLGGIVDRNNSVSELNETNNSFTGAKIGLGAGPDLVVASISGPSSAFSGQPITVQANICNRGNDWLNGGNVNVYISQDTTIDGTYQTPWPTDDVLIGTLVLQNSVGPGQCRTLSGYFSAQAAAPYTDGPYYLGAIADEQNFVYELDETNNELAGPQMGIGYGADLVVTSITAPHSAQNGQQITVTAKVCNYGTAQSNIGQVGIYLSQDTTVDGRFESQWSSDDVWVGNIGVPNTLFPGQCRDATGFVPAVTPYPYGDGVYYFGAIVDENNVEQELNETNNEFIGPQLGIGPYPDVVVTAISGPGGAMYSEQIPVEATVCNYGQVPVYGAEVSFYTSADTTIVSAFGNPPGFEDSYVGSLLINDQLYPGQCRDLSGFVFAYPGAPYFDGPYYFAAYADERNVIWELNETNNVFVGELMGIGNGPDLVITSISGPPSASPGFGITVEATVCNRGTTSAAGAEINYYFSADTTIDGYYENYVNTDDTFAGTLSISDTIDPDECRTSSGTIFPYMGAPYTEGPYYFAAIVDERNFQLELVETNNEFLGERMGIGFGPDLVVSSITGPPSAQPGQSFTVQASICNYGNQPLSNGEIGIYLSQDTTIDGAFETLYPSDDSLIGVIYFYQTLNPGRCRTESQLVTAWAPAPYNEGPYYLAAIADERRLVYEINDENNETVGAQMGIGSQPDLVIASVSAPSSAFNGQQISVTVTFCNRGTVPSSNVEANIYFSRDQTIDGFFQQQWPSEDIWAGTVVLNTTLFGGQCREATGDAFAYTPYPYSDGAYYLGAIVDERGLQPELNEANNEFVDGQVGIGSGPDLVVTSILGPPSAQQGQQIEIEATVCNYGTQPAAGIEVFVYLSQDTTIDGFFGFPPPNNPLDSYLGSVLINNSLTPGQCRNGSALLSAYPGAPYTDGAYYLAAIVDERRLISELNWTNNTRVGSQMGIGNAPDLVVTSITGPASAYSGQTIDVETTVCNQGTTFVAAPEVNVYLSADAAIEGYYETFPSMSDDAFLGVVYFSNGLVPGECDVQSSQVAAQAAAPYFDGAYYLGAIVDERGLQFELNDQNNERVGARMGIGIQPDLVITSITGPTSAQNGQMFEVEATVCNQGTSPSPGTGLGIYLSYDTTIDGQSQILYPSDDSLLGVVSVAPLSVGECRTVTGDVFAWAPWPYFDGAYYLGAIIDEMGFVYELDESNNETTGTQMGIGSMPDLVITSITGPGGAQQGQQITVTAVVCNYGSVAVSNGEVNVYLSYDQTIVGEYESPWSSEDGFLGTILVNNTIYPGQCRPASGDVSVYSPEPYFDGPYYLGGIVDERGIQPELNESNNEFVGGQMGIGNGPDLVVTSISGPASAQQGQQITVQATVCNHGTFSIGGVEVFVYLSEDTELEGIFQSMQSDDSYLGSIFVNQPLNPGQCRTASGEVNAYPGAPYFDGAYYLGAIADERQVIWELNETNNELTGTRMGIGNGLDLVVSAISGPSSVQQGQNMTVQATVCNRGTFASPGSEVYVYLSPDPSIDGMFETMSPFADGFTGEIAFASIAPGACRTESASGYANLPWPFIEGPHYLGAIVDERNLVYELDESNNELTGALIGIGNGPDLVVSAISGPASAQPGQSFTVLATVCNRGTQTAGGGEIGIYLSYDTTIDGQFETQYPSDDALIGQANLSQPLNAGECRTESIPANAWTPAPFIDGPYYLGAIIDERNFVYELLDSNNEMIGPQIGIGSRPDLVVTSISGPTSAQNGQQINITAMVCNQGTVPAGTADVNIYLSFDQTIDGIYQTPWASDDGFLGTISAPTALFPGQCRAATGYVTAYSPWPYFDGPYYLGAIIDERQLEAELYDSNNELTGGQMGIGNGPDLVVTSITGPASAQQGEQIDVRATVCNHGTQSTGAAEIFVYLSADTVIDGIFQSMGPSEDSYLGSIFVNSPLSPGQCRSADGQLSAFPGAPYFDGSYYLGAIADERQLTFELNESNNELTGALIGIGNGPDLVLTSVSGPPSATHGGPFTAEAILCNRGTSFAPGAEVNIYLSTQLQGSIFFGNGLAPGECESESTQLYALVPAPGGDGVYVLRGVVDEQNFINELIETNNALSGTAMGIGSGTDLLVTAIRGPASAAPGQQITIDATVCNQGTVPAPGAEVNIYASQDTTIDGQFQTQYPTDDALWAQLVAAGSLNPGECAEVSGSATAWHPVPFTDGAYYLGAIVDENNSHPELNETNNELTGDRIGIGNQPDLVIASITGPASAQNGQNIDVEVEVCNRGTQPAASAEVNIYLSAGAAAIDGQLLGSAFVGALAANSCATANTSVPAVTPPPYVDGAYYLGAIVDEQNIQPELIEDNNRLAGEVIGIGNGPDLVVSVVSGESYALPHGGPYEVSSSVCNVGTAMSPPSQVTYYLSADAEIGESDEELGFWFVPDLAPGECHTEATTVNTPGTGEGTYFVGAIVDLQGFVFELVEVNNARAGNDVEVAFIFCGNGAVDQIDEQCDDGNFDDGDGCTSSCGDEYCGDGTVNDGGAENCDDGNSAGGDGCSATCQTEYCGDGTVNNSGTEQCDDGNTASGDGCNTSCQDEYCGDSVINDGGAENCDDGNINGGDGCSPACRVEFCSDGVVNNNGTEQCDDGNITNWDGCSSTCAFESPRFGEVGRVTASQPNRTTWHTVNLQRTYLNPVVIMEATSSGDAAFAHLRVRNVTANSFQWQIEEWQYLDGVHGTETANYIVLEAGRRTLEDGTIVEAGRTTANHNFRTVNFAQAFAVAPVVLTSVISTVDTVPVVTRTRNTLTNRFDVRVQEEEAQPPAHGTETISWIAIVAGNGMNNGQPYMAERTPTSVGDAWYTRNFAPIFGAAPVFIGHADLTNGTDPVALRWNNLTSGSVQLMMEEDDSADAEHVHTAEAVTYIAWGAPGFVTFAAAASEAPLCSDLLDNDGDQRTDCADPECAGISPCP